MSDTDTPDPSSEEAADTDQPAEPEPPTRYGARLEEGPHGTVLHATREQYLDVLAAAHADGFDQLTDLTAVDYLTFVAPRPLPDDIEPERFEVVTQLICHARPERIRIRVQVPADDAVLPTAFDHYPGAETLEREVFDMFGIEFADHPDMSRILMPEEWEGHPLRKDYDVGAIPVQFKTASNIR